MTFALEIAITIGFWSFVYDAPKEPTTARTICLFMDHSLPFTLLLIDFLSHRIHYEIAHLCINLIFLGAYGIDNFVFCKMRHTYVYPVIHWDSWLTYIAAFMIIPLFMLLWVAVCLISECKMKKFGLDKPCPVFAAAMKGLTNDRPEIDDTMTMPTFKSDNDAPFLEEEAGASEISRATGKDGINLTRSEISSRDIRESVDKI
jgi:hypothetical protein